MYRAGSTLGRQCKHLTSKLRTGCSPTAPARLPSRKPDKFGCPLERAEGTPFAMGYARSFSIAASAARSSASNASSLMTLRAISTLQWRKSLM